MNIVPASIGHIDFIDELTNKCSIRQLTYYTLLIGSCMSSLFTF